MAIEQQDAGRNTRPSERSVICMILSLLDCGVTVRPGLHKKRHLHLCNNHFRHQFSQPFTFPAGGCRGRPQRHCADTNSWSHVQLISSVFLFLHYTEQDSRNSQVVFMSEFLRLIRFIFLKIY